MTSPAITSTSNTTPTSRGSAAVRGRGEQVDDVNTRATAMLEGLVEYWREAMTNDEEISGADAVEYLMSFWSDAVRLLERSADSAKHAECDGEQQPAQTLTAREKDLLSACESTLAWLIEAEEELGGPLPLKYVARMHKPRIAQQLHDAITIAHGSDAEGGAL